MDRECLLKKGMDVVTLILLGFYLVDISLNYIVTAIRVPTEVEIVLFAGMFLIAVWKLFSMAIERKWESLCTAILVLVVCFLSYIYVSYPFIPWLGAIIVATSGIDYKKILTTYLITIGILLSITVLLAWTGGISNLIYGWTSEDRIRSSWGVVYPTDFASYFLFFAIILWVRVQRCSEWFLLIPAGGVFFLANTIAKSNTSSLCALCFIVAILVDCLINVLKKKKHIFKIFKKIFDVFLKLIFPAFAIVSFLSLYAWHLNLPIADKINEFMNGRLVYVYQDLQEYGIHAFGGTFDVVGNGGGNFAKLQAYNFIDNSYFLLLIRYGWVFFLLIMYLWEKSLSKALRRNNYRIAFAMAIIALHALSEHHFPELNYNIFLLLPFATIGKEKKKPEEYKEINISLAITTGLVSAGGFVLLPKSVSILRTLFSVYNLTGTWISSLNMAFFTSFGFVIGVILLAFLVYRTFFCFLMKKPIKIVYTGLTCCVVAGAVALTFLGNEKLREHYDEYRDLFDQESTVINLVKDSKQGNLYASDIPEYYQMYFGGFTDRILSNEELAKEENTTLVVASDFDSYILSAAEFQWLQISDKHAIYTNDASVIQSLEENGYTLSSFNVKVNTVNLYSQAEWNGTPLNEDASYPINPETSMLCGPYLDLHSGTFVVRCTLTNLNLENGSDGDMGVGKLTVTAYYGEMSLGESEIMLSHFDENGNCELEFSFYSPNATSIEFKMESENGASFNIVNMTYQRQSL